MTMITVAARIAKIPITITNSMRVNDGEDFISLYFIF